MIEVNLYEIPAKNVGSTVGRCIDRSRFDKEALGTSVLDFVKGFLKTNLHNFDAALQNPDLVSLINEDGNLTAKDFACINYYLAKAGYMVQIQNVTDDEDNPTSVPAETIEWNIIDRNFLQFDYPTATKINQASGADIIAVLDQIIQESGLFDNSKFAGIKNPLKEIVETLKQIKNIKGSVESSPVTKAYEILDQLGITIFCAFSED